MGFNIDESLTTGTHGIYTFRAQGSIYHSIGSLLPNENCRPRYMQMWIVDTDHDIDNRIHENLELRREFLLMIQNILGQHNPFVHVFLQIGKCEDIPNFEILLYKESVNLISIQDVVGYYDPLQYPLLLSYGTYGWDLNSRNINGTRLTCLNYYAYMLQIRENSPSLILRGELYQGLQDCLHGGENNEGNIGTRIVLPSSFGGSPRDMYQRYQDAMTLKRGLPQVHMLVIFENNDNFCTPDHFDSIVHAEIPLQTEEPNLHKAVVHHMIHGPCGSMNPNCPSVVNGKCKKNFPKPFVEYTSRGNDSYPLYQRREGGQVSIPNNDDVFIDNGWVVPYNPWPLLKYGCHINVEVCGGIKCVKYIYKYIHKGPDRVALELRNEQNCDEIQQYVDGRWICAPEAFWRIFSFEFSRMYPSVIRLQLHKPN
ncbi:uncharacterized protein [Primulina eburnea]|uniref:uncharacterized protein n=1 Tax=Primulina eburnea TaxID=1245227 RepID=UPI003C6BEA29